MLYTIRISCGHVGTVELFGPDKDREQWIRWFQTEGLCQSCYQKAKAIRNPSRTGDTRHLSLWRTS